MILALGTDSTDIYRFNLWHCYKKSTLEQLFHPYEIQYCLNNISKSAERFAVRFAAKEAFFKAFSTIIAPDKLYLRTVCKNVHVIQSEHGIPHLLVNWDVLWPSSIKKIEPITIHLSLSHSKTMATAFIILEKPLF